MLNALLIPFQLSLEKILDFGLSHRIVVDSLPPLREILKMPRSYVCNVIYTRIGPTFQAWVDGRCQERNEKLAIEKDLAIQLDPHIAEAFRASTNVSRKSITSFSSSAFLIIDNIIALQNPREPVGS